MIPNLETLSNVSGASLWLREMAIDFAGKQFVQQIDREIITGRILQVEVANASAKLKETLADWRSVKGGQRGGALNPRCKYHQQNR